MVPICERGRNGQGLRKLRSSSTALSLNKINDLKDRFRSLPTKSHLSFERQNTPSVARARQTQDCEFDIKASASLACPRIQIVRLKTQSAFECRYKGIKGLKELSGQKRQNVQGRQKICILGSGFLSWDGGASIFKQAIFVFSSPMKRGQRSCSHTPSKRLKESEFVETETVPETQ